MERLRLRLEQLEQRFRSLEAELFGISIDLRNIKAFMVKYKPEDR